jgi:DNA polymerase III subunit delta'
MELQLHPSTLAQLRAIGTNPKGSYLFIGPDSTERLAAARWLARQLNCQGDQTGPCAQCRQIEAGNFPDWIVVRPEGKASIGIAQIQQLITALALQVYGSGTRVVAIDQAASMTIEAQNSLLKTLEEPPQGTIIILITARADDLLPTVQSRAELLQFRPVDSETTMVSGQSASVELADKALTAELFERLLIAAELAKAGEQAIAEFSAAIKSRLTTELRRAASSQAPVEIKVQAARLEAYIQFERYRSSNMPMRLALESLMLAL